MTRFETPTTVEGSVEALRELLIETGERLADRPLELFREIGPTECVDPGNRGALQTDYSPQ